MDSFNYLEECLIKPGHEVTVFICGTQGGPPGAGPTCNHTVSRSKDYLHLWSFVRALSSPIKLQMVHEIAVNEITYLFSGLTWPLSEITVFRFSY